MKNKTKITVSLRKEDLGKQLKRQNSTIERLKRELKLEAVLDRVRAVCMGMKQPGDLLDICETVYTEIKALGFTELRNAMIHIHDDDQGFFLNYDYSDRAGKTVTKIYYDSHPSIQKWVNRVKKSKEAFAAIEIKGRELNTWREYRKSLGEEDDPRLDNTNTLTYYFYSIGVGVIGISTYSPIAKAKHNLLRRFGTVFDFAYRRYTEVRLAEVQAREARIEAALERVRSRAMAMQNSSELADLVATVFNELTHLDFTLTSCTLWINNPETITNELWVASNEINKPAQPYYLKAFRHSFFRSIVQAWKAKDRKWIFELSGEEKKTFEDLFFEDVSSLPEILKTLLRNPEKVIFSASFSSFGALEIVGIEPLSDEKFDILHRFGSVFDLTFTRFNDLKQAEAQAREAQIQLALERVRARTMAMQKSDELPETSYLLFQQVEELGYTAMQNSIGIVNESVGYVELSTTVHGHHLPHTLNVPINDPYVMAKAVAAWKAKHKSLCVEIRGQELKAYNERRNSFFETKVIFPEDQWIVNIVFFSKGWLSFSSNNNISEETYDLLKRFAAVFEQTYTRFLDLQKAEAQTREAQIEIAVERVRAKALAMHKSDEIMGVAVTMRQELESLNLPAFDAATITLRQEDGSIRLWDNTSAKQHDDGTWENTEFIFSLEHYHPDLYLKKIWNSKARYCLVKQDEEDLKITTDWVRKLDKNLADVVVSYYKEKGINQAWHPAAQLTHGWLNLDFYQQAPEPEVESILLKMAAAFDLAYKRFLDLQNAEAQTREAKIEAALERTRTQSMLMQHSSELDNTLRVFHEQVILLGIHSAFSFLWLPDEDKDRHIFWAAWAENNSTVFRSKAINYPLDRNEPATAQCLVDWKGKEPVVSYHVPPEGVENYFAGWQELIAGVELLKPEYFSDGLYYVEAYMKYGCFGVMIKSELPVEEKKILGRFAIEFERTYTRFLDLQKAEAQAREAQIEAALERIRSRTIGMQRSTELQDAAFLLFQQIQSLGAKYFGCGFNIWDDDKKAATAWMAREQGFQPPFKTSSSEDVFFHIHEAAQKGESLIVIEQGGQVLERHYKYMASIPVFRKITDKMAEAGLSVPSFQIIHCAFFSHGYLMFISFDPVPEAYDIFKRFAKVFEQTYTRFLDLQKAEAQAREAIKRASVDRVRAEIASMRTTNDLDGIIPLIWNELTTLGVPFIRCGVFIMDEAQKQIQTLLSTPEGKSIASFQLPFDDTEPLPLLLPHWQRKEIYKEHWDEAAFIESTIILMRRGAISSQEQYPSGFQPTNLHLHFLPFLQGMLYVGSEVPLSDDEVQLAQNLAEAFSTACARYEDFNKLEAANNKIEKTLVDLKLTQAQLIQSEKMASLGQLTAGIAHEIQNPLNFVNNFSEVNAELIDEIKQAAQSGNNEEVLSLAENVKQNLEKINFHGKRADGIVKSMLQHSRSSDQNAKTLKEPTDINDLADEYLRLAYHGLRAKDKTFNATLHTDFDEAIGLIEVVRQDIGRAILNLITNAFYVVHELEKSKKEKGQMYAPTVSIFTKKLINRIEIHVKDNGSGIPQHILDKIFQPFFTTKPTGQGTGLGLSLAYDIVKAHGGEVRVETEVGVGSEFIIQLPVV